MTQHGLGAIPSLKDERDYRLSRTISKVTDLPEEFSCNPDLFVPKDQGRINSCVAHSLAYLAEWHTYKTAQRLCGFGTDFIYGLREKDAYRGEGMYPRDALKTFLKKGNLRADLLKSNTEVPKVFDLRLDRPLFLAEAYPYRISAYAKLNSDEEVKAAVLSIGPVTATFPVVSALYGVGADGVVAEPNDDDKVQGYHQMTILGWDATGWIVLNSWGSGWGKNGMCHLPYAYPYVEAWSVSDDIGNFEKPPMGRLRGWFRRLMERWFP